MPKTTKKVKSITSDEVTMKELQNCKFEICKSLGYTYFALPVELSGKILRALRLVLNKRLQSFCREYLPIPADQLKRYTAIAVKAGNAVKPHAAKANDPTQAVADAMACALPKECPDEWIAAIVETALHTVFPKGVPA